MTVFGRLHDWLPPVAARALSGEARHSLSFREVDGAWDDARAAAGGYDAPAILERVAAATRRVVRGEAAYERDGVTFTHPEVRWPVLGTLLRSALRHGGSLRVLDFGGSLGSTYWQHRRHLDGLDVRWAVVEQPAFVVAGREFENGVLSFHDDVLAATEAVTPTLVLASSVLQYLADPWGALNSLAGSSSDTVLIDRTTISVNPGDRLTVEHVPASIYAGSYPAWILDRSRLLSAAPGWTVVDDFAGLEPDMRTNRGWHFRWRGLLLEKDS